MNQSYPISDEQMLEDKELKCKKCESEFVWSIGEQEFMLDLLEKGKVGNITTPRHCKSCRLKRKEEKERRENRN